MKFEEFIKKISATIACLVIFFLAASFYLAQKGFVMGSDNRLVLISDAMAKPIEKPINNNANLDLPKNHVLGKKNAPITIYEYSSLGCFHCASFHLSILPSLQKEYIDSGKVKIIYADFPLDKKSFQAAMVSRCIPKENYYSFLTLLYKKQREWNLSKKTEELLAGYASLNGISKAKALECLNDKKIGEEISNIRQEGISRLGIQGTPTLLIVAPSGRETVQGVSSYAELKQVIEEKLKTK